MLARSYEDFAPRGGARDYLGEHAADVDERRDRRQRELSAAERRRQTLDELEEEARNLAEYTRSKMEEMGERIRDTAGSTRDRARETFGLSGTGDASYLPDEQHRRYDESVRSAADKASEHARRGANRARGRVEEVGDRTAGWTERTRRGLDDATSGARDRVSDVGDRVGDRVSDWRESIQDVGASARDRVSDWGERTRERVEELGSMARDRLQDFGGKVQELGGKAGDYGGSVKYQVGDTMDAARGRAQETWRHNADAAREIGGTAGREYCLPLPTDRICARHALWVLLPLLFFLAAWYLRRRNPDKWSAGMKKLRMQREAMGEKAQSIKDQAALGSKLQSAKNQALETLQEQQHAFDKKKDK